MSNDGRVLIVERFDVDERGVPVYGLEDACGLLGLPPHEKYATAMVRVLQATRAYLPPARARAQLEQLGWQPLTHFIVRNADYHAKNIALYYDSLADVTYTPAHDIVTTQAYPRYANNPPGLSMEGRKTWTPGKSLERFFSARLGIAPRDYAAMVERLCNSAVAVGHEIIDASKREPRWRDIAKQMLHAWNEGMASLRSPKPVATANGSSASIEAAGFSAPQAPEPKGETIGRSAPLAKRGTGKRRTRSGRSALLRSTTPRTPGGTFITLWSGTRQVPSSLSPSSCAASRRQPRLASMALE